MAMKPKNNKKNQKPKLNITLHEDAKEKLAALARIGKTIVNGVSLRGFLGASFCVEKAIPLP